MPLSDDTAELALRTIVRNVVLKYDCRMDFSRPFRALTPTLDGPVLRVLAKSTSPMTRRQVTDLVDRASEAGVRKVLNRLAEQGIVIEERIGSNYTYAANREHIMWPAVEIIMDSHNRLEEKIREYVESWTIQPFSVELFGSVAAGTSTSESDIDVMIYRPHIGDESALCWDEQVADLSAQVERWTGNVCEVLEIDPPALVEMTSNKESALLSPSRPLVGVRAGSVFPSAEFAKSIAEIIHKRNAFKDIKFPAMTQAALSPALQRTLAELGKNYMQSPEMTRAFKNMQESIAASLGATSLHAISGQTSPAQIRQAAEQPIEENNTNDEKVD